MSETNADLKAALEKLRAAGKNQETDNQVPGAVNSVKKRLFDSSLYFGAVLYLLGIFQGVGTALHTDYETDTEQAIEKAQGLKKTVLMQDLRWRNFRFWALTGVTILCTVAFVAVHGYADNKSYDKLVDALTEKYPELSDDAGIKKLKRILAVVPSFISRLSSDERKELDKALAIKVTNPAQEFEQMQAIAKIMTEHLAKSENEKDLQMFIDAVENKAMPWEIAKQQYTQTQQGYGSRS